MSNDFSEEKLKAQLIGGLEEYINEAIPKFAEKINNDINEDYKTKKDASVYAGFKELQLKKPVVKQDEKQESKKSEDKKPEDEKSKDKKTKGKKPKDEKNKSNVSESNQEINQSKKK